MEWISVKDRLPDFEVYVLFTDGARVYFGEYNCRDKGLYFNLSNTNVDHWNDKEVNRKTCGFIAEYEPYGQIDFEEVTHWMALPEPPKE